MFKKIRRWVYRNFFKDLLKEDLQINTELSKGIYEPMITESFHKGRQDLYSEIYNRIWFTGKQLQIELSSRQIMTLLRITLNNNHADELMYRQEGKSTLLMTHLLYELSEITNNNYIWVGINQHNLAHTRDMIKRKLNGMKFTDDRDWTKTKRENKNHFEFEQTNNRISFITKGTLMSGMRGYRAKIVYVDECRKEVVDVIREMEPSARIISLRTEFEDDRKYPEWKPSYFDEKSWERFKARMDQFTPKSK